MYIVKDTGESECETRVIRTRYYAIGIPQLMELMSEAGFANIRRIDDIFFQPAIIGTRKA